MTTGVDGSTYTYDSQNRLLTATKGTTTDTFTYDSLNRQVSRKIGTATPLYNVYDGWQLIGEYNPNATSPLTAYLTGAAGLAKGMTASGSFYYYQDASGSTSHLADSSGHLTEWYRYDLQGTPLFFNASNTQLSASSYGIRHLFTGQQWYREIGLYDLRNRYYSPDIGRFLQADPIGFVGGRNLYRYGHNNPLKHVDPTGLATAMDPGYQPDHAPSAEAGRVIVTGDPLSVFSADPNNLFRPWGSEVFGSMAAALGAISIWGGGSGIGGASGLGPARFSIRTGVTIPLPPTLADNPLFLPGQPSTATFTEVTDAVAAAIDAQGTDYSLEDAGTIYQNPDGTYGYTDAKAPTNTSSASSPGVAPTDTYLVGYWHLHPLGSTFSSADMNWLNSVHNVQGAWGFLGLPNGAIQMYVPLNVPVIGGQIINIRGAAGGPGGP